MVPDPVRRYSASGVKASQGHLPIAMQQPCSRYINVMVSNSFRTRWVHHMNQSSPPHGLGAVVVLHRHRAPVNIDVQPARVDVVVRHGWRIEPLGQVAGFGDVVVASCPIAGSSRQYR